MYDYTVIFISLLAFTTFLPMLPQTDPQTIHSIQFRTFAVLSMALSEITPYTL